MHAALTNLYSRPPTNEDIEQDFNEKLEDAWLAVGRLYIYLSACHQDGLLHGDPTSIESALKDLKKVMWRVKRAGCDFQLDFPSSTAVKAIIAQALAAAKAA